MSSSMRTGKSLHSINTTDKLKWALNLYVLDEKMKGPFPSHHLRHSQTSSRLDAKRTHRQVVGCRRQESLVGVAARFLRLSSLSLSLALSLSLSLSLYIYIYILYVLYIYVYTHTQ